MVHTKEKHILQVKNLSGGYRGKAVIRNFNLKIQSGHIVCILGPNGIGKTTMLRTLLGLLPVLGGSVSVDGKNYKDMSQKERARHISYVPQAHSVPFSFRVIDVAALGRIASLGMFENPGQKDIEAADRVLEELGISFLRDRIFTEISGGERQMVMIARALVQASEFMILDEPTSNLDYGNQIRVLGTLNRLRRQGFGIIMTTHFPDHAFLCDADVILMGKDGMILSGSAEEVITEEHMLRAYGVPIHIFEVDDHGQKLKICEPVLSDF